MSQSRTCDASHPHGNRDRILGPGEGLGAIFHADERVFSFGPPSEISELEEASEDAVRYDFCGRECLISWLREPGGMRLMGEEAVAAESAAAGVRGD